MYLNDYDFHVFLIHIDVCIDMPHPFSATGNNKHEWREREVTGGIALMCFAAGAALGSGIHGAGFGCRLFPIRNDSHCTCVPRNSLCARDRSLNFFEEVNVTSDVFAGVKPFETMNELNQITHSTPIFP